MRVLRGRVKMLKNESLGSENILKIFEKSGGIRGTKGVEVRDSYKTNL